MAWGSAKVHKLWKTGMFPSVFMHTAAAATNQNVIILKLAFGYFAGKAMSWPFEPPIPVRLLPTYNGY